MQIQNIKIGERLRTDNGNLQELAESIRTYGLLHPVVIDQDNNLVAGFRRLSACKLLGWTEIETKTINCLTEVELREIELEENIKRKELRPVENSRCMIELARMKEASLRKQQEQDFSAESANNSHVRRGRPVTGVSKETIANEIGIPRKTLHDAEEHIKAVEKYPDLEELPKYKAIQTAKERDEEAKGLVSFDKVRREHEEKENEQQKRDYENEKRLREALNAINRIPEDEGLPGSIIRHWAFMDNGIDDQLDWIQKGIDRLTTIRDGIRKEKFLCQNRD